MFIWCDGMKNYHKLVSNQHSPGGSQFWGQQSRSGVAGFSARDPTTLNWSIGQIHSSSPLWLRVLFQAHSGCSQKSVPCSCRTKVPLSLRAASEDCPQQLEATQSPPSSVQQQRPASDQIPPMLPVFITRISLASFNRAQLITSGPSRITLF